MMGGHAFVLCCYTKFSCRKPMLMTIHMRNYEFIDRGLARTPYASPDVKVVEITVQRVLCGSGGVQSDGIDDFNMLTDDSGNW